MIKKHVTRPDPFFLAGHLDWYDGQTGSFENLYKVKHGNEIVVRDENGTDITFVVREIKMYDAEEDATDVFFFNGW